MHIEKENGDCVLWCARCRKINDLAKRYADAPIIDLYERILDLEAELSVQSICEPKTRGLPGYIFVGDLTSGVAEPAPIDVLYAVDVAIRTIVRWARGQVSPSPEGE